MTSHLLLLASTLSFALPAFAGGVYWSDRPSTPKAIRACDFSGANVRNVASLVSTRDPRGIVVDAAGERLYFCDRVGASPTATSGEVDSVALNGAGGVSVALTTLNRPADLRFDAATRTLFWCEENGGLIRKATAALGGAVSGTTTLFTGQAAPYYIDFVASSGTLYWGANGATITSGPATGGVANPPLYSAGLNNRGVCVDAAGGMIYWCEKDRGSIRRMPLSGGAIADVYAGQNAPHGLVLDLAARRLYWTDTGTNAGGLNPRGITRGNMDGSTAAEIVVAGTASNQPWDLDLDRRNATYAEWRARFFRYDSAVATSGPEADPDGDGLKNLSEYTLGLAPFSSDAAATEVLRVNNAGTDYAAIRFRRRAATSDLTIAVQVSTDLVTWNDNSTGAFTTEVSVVAAEDGIDLVTVRANTPLGTAPQHLRVKASLP